ncbi:MAG TPA: hypothetical protein VKG82_02955 [Solirubrobacteraceae bacterium]|nr:hypothetical protein [Solirubrobacteraceae bacterium]
MTRGLSRGRLLAAGLAIVLVLAGVLIAVLGSGPGKLSLAGGAGAGSARNEIPVAAGYLDMPASEVRRELRAGRSLAEIASSNGRSASGLIERLLARLAATLNAEAPSATAAERRARLAQMRARVSAIVNRHGAPVVISRANLLTAAAYLDLRPGALHRELASGRTLAQIANATPGRSSAAMVAALVAARAAALRAAAASGRLSSSREARLLATLQRRIAALVNRVPLG